MPRTRFDESRIVRSRRDAPAKWAWWWRSAISAFVPQYAQHSGVLRDIVGTNHGTVVNYASGDVMKQRLNGRLVTNANASDATKRWRSGYAIDKNLGTTGVTLWWFGVLRSGTVVGAPRLVSLDYSEPESAPYMAAAGITRAQYLNTNSYTTGGASPSLAVHADLGETPRLIVGTFDLGNTVLRTHKIYDQGALLVSHNPSSHTAPIYTETSHLIIHGHSTTASNTQDASTIAAGYMRGVLSAQEIAVWARDPMGPLLRQRRLTLHNPITNTPANLHDELYSADATFIRPLQPNARAVVRLG